MQVKFCDHSRFELKKKFLCMSDSAVWNHAHSEQTGPTLATLMSITVVVLITTEGNKIILHLKTGTLFQSVLNETNKQPTYYTFVHRAN